MIPKIIHCVWVGKKKRTKLFKKCLKSWRKYCSDYKIIIWNEENFDIKKYEHCQQAYNKGKFGFVPDTIRIDVLYRYGGVYLDTDVELIKPIDDLLDNKIFAGFESKLFVGNAVLAAEKNNIHLKNMLDIYSDNKFVKKNGMLNLKTGPQYLTEYLRKIGLDMNDKNQKIEDFKIYKKEYFYPIDYNGDRRFTTNTRTVHYWSASWQDKKSRIKTRFKIFMKKYKFTSKICDFYKKIKRRLNKS